MRVFGVNLRERVTIEERRIRLRRVINQRPFGINSKFACIGLRRGSKLASPFQSAGQGNDLGAITTVSEPAENRFWHESFCSLPVLLAESISRFGLGPNV